VHTSGRPHRGPSRIRHRHNSQQGRDIWDVIESKKGLLAEESGLVKAGVTEVSDEGGEINTVQITIAANALDLIQILNDVITSLHAH
jgi:hypothetical protein